MKWDDNAQGRFYYRGREHQEAQLQLAAKQLGNANGKSVLDVGCGYGDLLPYLPGRFQYLGIDTDNRAIVEARRQHPHHHFLRSRKASPADLVVAVATIQCVKNPAVFARDMWKHTRHTLVIVSCNQDKLPEERQELDWWTQLPNAEFSRSEDDYYAVTCRR